MIRKVFDSLCSFHGGKVVLIICASTPLWEQRLKSSFEQTFGFYNLNTLIAFPESQSGFDLRKLEMAREGETTGEIWKLKFNISEQMLNIDILVNMLICWVLKWLNKVFKIIFQILASFFYKSIFKRMKKKHPKSL